MNFLLIITLISSVIYSSQAGQCQVYSGPNYVSLATDKTDGKTVSDFKNNLLTLLGLSADKTDKAVFYSTNPLTIPSIWLFHIEGVDKLSDNGLPLVDDGGFGIDSFQSKLSNIHKNDVLSIGTIVLASDSDMDNLGQSLQSQMSKMNGPAPCKYIVIVCDNCQTDKLQIPLKSALDKIAASEPQTLVMTLTTTETARVRRARQAEQQTTGNVTIATMYSDEYPTMFNLFFWTSLAFALILISIVYVFLTLDPGSDTIIYRMTAPRLKVD
ncbi:unnamed protein product [Adineta steineri]|uniref:Renin receptor-like C-terminal transmembrane spanning segment domain-containing protein n=1 Tax=Adineta steineri TaxID=433720 RepID=A0A814CP49_9BILA|nr:unnamed protein product [Adineta steineri]CAF3490074.1 unnamed protein product [Adineta steineri]